MPKCDFTSAWVFSCKFAAYFQNEHLWTATSEVTSSCLKVLDLIQFNVKHIFEDKFFSMEALV